MESPGRYVAQVWHEVLMNSATAEDVAKYAPLAGRSPVELRILLLAGSTQDLPLSAYLAYQQNLGERILHGLNREEQQQLLALLQKIQSYMVRRP